MCSLGTTNINDRIQIVQIDGSYWELEHVNILLSKNPSEKEKVSLLYTKLSLICKLNKPLTPDEEYHYEKQEGKILNKARKWTENTYFNWGNDLRTYKELDMEIGNLDTLKRISKYSRSPDFKDRCKILWRARFYRQRKWECNEGFFHGTSYNPPYIYSEYQEPTIIKETHTQTQTDPWALLAALYIGSTL